jgi:glucose-6-phosphate-specific signal transduction histidine kinase
MAFAGIPEDDGSWEVDMTKNMHTIDRTVRIVIAALLLLAWAFGWVSGWLAGVLVVVALVFVATSFVGLCPLYRVLGVNMAERQMQPKR